MKIGFLYKLNLIQRGTTPHLQAVTTHVEKASKHQSTLSIM